jgi:hypothetical protein
MTISTGGCGTRRKAGFFAAEFPTRPVRSAGDFPARSIWVPTMLNSRRSDVR